MTDSNKKALIVEDDFAGRKILRKILSNYFECDVAVDGEEALAALKDALDEDSPYDLICLDIMMPKLDGHEVLKQFRQIEADKEITGLDGAKVIMTTGRDDKDSVLSAFRSGCEAYLVKPIERAKLIEKLGKLGLVEEGSE